MSRSNMAFSLRFGSKKASGMFQLERRVDGRMVVAATGMSRRARM
jgi:hypothetical protein